MALTFVPQRPARPLGVPPYVYFCLWHPPRIVPAVIQSGPGAGLLLTTQHRRWGIGGGVEQGVEEQGTWASRTQKHSEAGYGRPVDRGAWTAKTVKRPRQQPGHPQYANYWALLTRKRHIPPHPAQSQHANYWAPRTRKRHQQEHRPQRPTERSDPTQHAKGRTGDCPGPRKGATTRWNVTQGGGGEPWLRCCLGVPSLQGGHGGEWGLQHSQVTDAFVPPTQASPPVSNDCLAQRTLPLGPSFFGASWMRCPV